MARDGLGDPPVARGGQHDAPTPGALGAHQLEDARLVGQERRIERGMLGQPALQPRAAAQEPERDGGRDPGRTSKRRGKRLVQCIGPEQRAIEIDAQGQVGLAGELAPRLVRRAHSSEPWLPSGAFHAVVNSRQCAAPCVASQSRKSFISRL